MKSRVIATVSVVLFTLLVAVLLYVRTEAEEKVDTVTAEEKVEVMMFSTYVVKNGDTLWQIASDVVDGVHLKTTADAVRMIAELNNLNNPNAIQAGAKLLVPYWD